MLLLPGGGGILGGPPACGIGCCCNGGGRPLTDDVVDGVPDGISFGSASSHSDDKSPELNLKQITIYTDIDRVAGKRGACERRHEKVHLFIFF